MTFCFLDFNSETGGNIDSPEAKTVVEANDIALLGRPKLGEIYRCQVRIKESKEFKVWFAHLDLSLFCLFYSSQ